MGRKVICASDISKLLRQKHPVDKFLSVEECKTGSSWFATRCARLDMWVMARSWAHPRFIGYEIKVNRQDFLRDTKWQDYLKYCTEFYFVSPPDIIAPEELPEDAGLIITSKNAKRLYTKKKAPMRSVDIPEDLFIYILMCRVQVVGDMFNTRPSHEMWKERLNQITSRKKVGHAIGHIISSKVNEKVKEILTENTQLRGENRKLLEIKTWLDDKGVNLDSVPTGYGIRKDRLIELTSGLPFNLVHFLETAETNLKMAVDALRKT